MSRGLGDEPEGEEENEKRTQTRYGLLPTGVEALDKVLNGGIPSGRIVAFLAPSGTQGELLLKQLTLMRSTLYLSTLRPEWEVRGELADYIQYRAKDNSAPEVIHVKKVSPGPFIRQPKEYLAEIDSKTNLIINSIDEFEFADQREYISFLNKTKHRLWETGSIGFLYATVGDRDHPARRLTLKRADLVWELQRNISDKEIEHYLVVSKFRGGTALREPIKIELTDQVRIDTSHD